MVKKITENTLKLIEKERDGEQVNSTLIAKALGFEIYKSNLTLNLSSLILSSICTAIRPSSKISKVSWHRNKAKLENLNILFAPQ